MHYEVERRELAYTHDGISMLRITGRGWKAVMVFQGDAITTPLTFDSLEAAQAGLTP
jgi:hypothetical protein